MRKTFAAETGIIIMGVLLALGAESWWQSRSELQRAHEYVNAVRSDMLEFRPMLDSAIAIQRADIESTTTGLALLLVDTPVPDTLTISRWASGSVSIPLGTLDALIQTGDVNRIKDEGLRLSIVRARSELNELQTRLRGDVGTENFRQLVLEGERARVAEDLDPFGGVPTVLAMRGNTSVTAAYRYHRLESSRRLRRLEEVEAVVARLLQSIEISLAQRGAT